MTTAQGFVADRPEQIDALASPARQEIVDVLEVSGPCTAAELARQTGRAADSLYYHLRQLIAVDLVTESAGERGEAQFDLPGRPFRVSYAALAAHPDGLARMARGILRLTERNLASAAADGRLELDPPNFMVGRAQGWFTRAEADELLALLQRAHRRALEHRDPGAGERYAITLALTPLPCNRS